MTTTTTAKKRRRKKRSAEKCPCICLYMNIYDVCVCAYVCTVRSMCACRSMLCVCVCEPNYFRGHPALLLNELEALTGPPPTSDRHFVRLKSSFYFHDEYLIAAAYAGITAAVLPFSTVLPLLFPLPYRRRLPDNHILRH